MWQLDPITGEYFKETWIPHYKQFPHIGHTHRVDIWEYSKGCWVAADSSVLSGGNYMNLRWFLPSAQDVMDTEDDLLALIDEILKEL